MKRMVLVVLAMPLSAYPVLPAGVTQEAVDVMIREETGLSQDRFKGKLYCNFEKPKHCLPEGMKEKSWIDANNKLTNALCFTEVQGAPSKFGVTDQWKCLTKWQEIREDFWQARHDEFFKLNTYISKDYFERWEFRYPKAIPSPAYIQGAVEDGYWLNVKCDLLDYDCVNHLSVSYDIYVKWIKERYCSYKGMSAASDVGTRIFQRDAEAGKQCMDFAMELIKLGYPMAVSNPPGPFSGYFDKLKSSYEDRIKDIENMKRLFSSLKSLALRPEWAMTDDNFHLPTHIALRKAILKLQKIIKNSDPNFDVTVAGIDVQGKPLDESTLPLKSIQERVGEIKAPLASIGAVRTQKNVIEETAVVSGNYTSPGVARVEILQKAILDTEGKTRQESIYYQYRDGKPLVLEPGIFIDQSQDQVTVATNKKKADRDEVRDVLPAVPKVTNYGGASVPVELPRLAEMKAKMEITYALNCQDDVSGRACQYYQTYFKEFFPTQLDVYCKEENCQKEFDRLVAEKKKEILNGLSANIDSFTGQGAFVDPFKASSVLEETKRSYDAYASTVKPLIDRNASRQVTLELSSNIDPLRVAEMICDSDQQRETGGNYSSCVSNVRSAVPKLSFSSFSRGLVLPDVNLPQLTGETIKTSGLNVVTIDSNSTPASDRAGMASDAGNISVSGAGVIRKDSRKNKLSEKELREEARKAKEIFDQR